MTDGHVIRHRSPETAAASAIALSVEGGTRQGHYKQFTSLSEVPSDSEWSVAQAEATSFQQEVISQFSLPAPRVSIGFRAPSYGEQSLKEILVDLEHIDEMAKEDDLPEPDGEAVANAYALLPQLYAILPVRYHVSPTERGGVSIDVPMKRGRTVSVECAPNNHVYCFVTIDGNSRRAKFYQVEGLPDPFMERALRDFAGA